MTVAKIAAAMIAACALCCQAGELDVLRTGLSGAAESIDVFEGAIPGVVVVSGGNAEPLAFGVTESGVKAAVAAAATFGKGRVVAVTHQGFFEKDAARGLENVAFLRGCLLWLGGGTSPAKVYVDKRWKAIAECMQNAFKGVRIEVLDGYEALDSIPPGSVFVTMPDSHSLKDAERLSAFVRNGGAVLASVVGWGWRQIRGGGSFGTESPFNAAFGAAGLYACDEYVKYGKDVRYAVSGKDGVPGVTVQSAMELVEKGGVIDARTGQTCLCTLQLLAGSLPPGDKKWLPRLKALGSMADGNIVPSPERPLGMANMRERISYMLLIADWQNNPERMWKANAAAAVYPGVPGKTSRRTTREVQVDLSVPRWHGTGLFAAAGEPLTVTLPDGAERLGLRVRVGTTECRNMALSEWRRSPVVDVEVPLSKRTVSFSSPFGGLVYIVVRSPSKGTVNVKVGPACPAPWFVEGRDTPETWAAQLRDSPAPFVELQNDHIVITAPYENAGKLADPRPLLQVWRKILDNDARLCGISPVRPCPERICIDVQLCMGYMHSGYPIMMPSVCASHLLSEPTIREGKEDNVWGFFHEMGHNHQHPDWTFEGTTEVTVNFFSLYNMQKICGRSIRENEKIGTTEMARKVREWNAAGRPVRAWYADPFLALDFFARLIEKYGWASFEKLFAEYAALPPDERPKTDLEKRKQWCSRLSRIVGEDLTPEFSFLLK